jgi:hypothetical protein
MDNKSLLDIVFEHHGILPKYMYEERVYYDTKDVFERHNFSREVKKKLPEEDFVVHEGKYYLSGKGILRLAAATYNNKLIDSLMHVLTAMPPAAATAPEPAEVYTSPMPQQAPLDLAMYMQPQPIVYPQQGLVYPQQGMYFQQPAWTFQSLYPQKQ